MPKITDKNLIPTVAPSEATRAAYRAFADRLRIEALTSHRVLGELLDTLIEDLDAGRGEGQFSTAIEVNVATSRIGRLVAELAIAIDEQVKVLDAAYHQALLPAKRAAGNLGLGVPGAPMSSMAAPSLSLLREVQEAHRRICNDATCPIHVALANAIEARRNA